MKSWICIGSAFFCLLWIGCSEESSGPAGGGTATVIEQEETAVIDHPPFDLPPESRSTKRLTVDMLAHSLPIVAGKGAGGEDITWTIAAHGSIFSALDLEILGGTLGKPDYVSTTIEATDPSMLYLKFMDDMARDVCFKMLQADLAEEDPEKRTLVRFSSLETPGDDESVYANLRYLKLRFHGVKVADDDTDSVALLKTLFDAVLEGGVGNPALATRGAWGAVCVGLFLSPEFHVY